MGCAVMKKTTFVAALLALLMGFPLASLAGAQVTSATIVGTITDTSGGALPGATVTARNTETGFSRTVVTSTEGAYRLEFLPIGSYVIEASLQGFTTANRAGIVLRVNDTVKIDISLAVGGLEETVTVAAAVLEVNTVTSDISKTIEAKQIETLPLVDRNVYTLLDLTPGVQSNNNGVASASATTSNLSLGFPEQRTLINGGADGGTGSVNYYLDGGINMTALRNTGNILPNPDAIQEFKVQTNAYNAEYGRFSSGIINVITKSGTNRYKGSVFEYLRDGNMNANDWAATVETPPLKRNQFGGSVGGPMQKDKTFFFASYSGLRQTSQTFLNNAVVPTDLERLGDFSQSKTIPTDPATGKAFTCNGVTGAICSNRLDPVAMKIINTLHPDGERPRADLAGLRPEPVRHRRVPDQGRPPVEPGAPAVGQLLLDERQQHGEGGHGQPAVGVPGIQVDAAQPERQRHVGDERQPDQPGVVLVQPQLRRPQQHAGGLAHGPRVVGHHHGRPVAAADYRQRLLHAHQRDRRPDGRRRLLLDARRVQLDHRPARGEDGRRDLLQQDDPGHAAQQLRRLHVQQQRDEERAGGLHDRHPQRGHPGRPRHRPVEQLVRCGVHPGRLPCPAERDAQRRPPLGRATARHRPAEPVRHVRRRAAVEGAARRPSRTAVLR